MYAACMCNACFPLYSFDFFTACVSTVYRYVWIHVPHVTIFFIISFAIMPDLFFIHGTFG